MISYRERIGRTDWNWLTWMIWPVMLHLDNRLMRFVSLARDWLLPLLWLGTLIAVGNADLVPVRGTNAPLFALRKLIHVGEYAILGVLICRALSLDRRQVGRQLGIGALALTVASGGIDEWQQSFVAGRAPRLMDLGFDAVGSALGLAWISIVRQRRRIESLRHEHAVNPGRRIHLLSAKRGFDLLLSGLGLGASAPLWGVIALAIKRDNSGPVFFRDNRVGLGGRIFTAYKFRTMVHNADALFGPCQAIEDDPRVTRVGRLLRVTAMDELPQLWNIFRGDMSFVGPRALRPGEIEVRSATFNVQGSEDTVQGSRFNVQGSKGEVQGSTFNEDSSRFNVQGSEDTVQGSRFDEDSSRFNVQGATCRVQRPSGPLRLLRERDERERQDESVDCGERGEAVTPLEEIPGYWKRHAVRPGLTGIAQIFADRDIPSRQKFRYDLLYIRRRSFWLDLRLVALSFWVTFRGRWEVRGTKF